MSLQQMFKQATAFYQNGAWNAAEQVCREILSQLPENPDVLNLVGLIAHAKGYPQTASDYFERVLRQTPNQAPVWFNLAVSLTACNKYRQAIEAYQNVLRLNAGIKEAYNNLGGLYEKIGEPQEAFNAYRHALALDKDYIEAAVNLAVLNKDWDGLKEIFNTCKNSPLPAYYLGLEEMHRGNLYAAAHLMNEALKIDKGIAEIWFQCALIAKKMHKEKSAVKCLKRVLALEPQNVPALINMAGLTSDEMLVQNALALEPNNPEAHVTYADILYAQNRKAEALEEYRKAVVLNPDMPELSNNLGLVLKDLGEYEQALDLFMNAFLKNRHIKDFAINLAETLVLLYRQNPRRALEIAQLWAHNAPENTLAKHTLDSFSRKKSDNDEAFSEEYFDTFAKYYDKAMQKIRYNIIQKIKELKIKVEGKVLDLGCGTGLAGEFLKKNGTTFTGVDISQRMLQIAASKKIYEKLIKDDLQHFLYCNKTPYDLIIALDVLDYTDSIADVFNAANKTPFLFSIENARPDVDEFSITPTGRYQHNPAYIRGLLIKNGYAHIKAYGLILRTEHGEPVHGTLFEAR